MNHDFIPQRVDYGDRGLDRAGLSSDPFEFFRLWMQEAVDAGVAEANAMCLGTLDSEGFPDARIVLLKGLERDSLVFYTNYESHKGKQLQTLPRASAVFWWEPLKRQVRFVGEVTRAPDSVSDAYFDSRPRESQLGAWASEQSKPLADRTELEERLIELDRRFPERVPRPSFWGGFFLRPHRIEFWQGRNSRLHDRFVFVRQQETKWDIQRLNP